MVAHGLSKEGTRNEAKFILGKFKFESMRPAYFRALRGAPLGRRAFRYCLTFAFVADHCENILRHFLRIFADRAHKMAESRKKWRPACFMHIRTKDPHS